jgi:hypothetical protein
LIERKRDKKEEEEEEEGNKKKENCRREREIRDLKTKKIAYFHE